MGGHPGCLKKKEPGNQETPPQRLKKLRILDMALARNYCSGRQRTDRGNDAQQSQTKMRFCSGKLT